MSGNDDSDTEAALEGYRKAMEEVRKVHFDAIVTSNDDETSSVTSTSEINKADLMEKAIINPDKLTRSDIEKKIGSMASLHRYFVFIAQTKLKKAKHEAFKMAFDWCECWRILGYTYEKLIEIYKVYVKELDAKKAAKGSLNSALWKKMNSNRGRLPAAVSASVVVDRTIEHCALVIEKRMAARQKLDNQRLKEASNGANEQQPTSTTITTTSTPVRGDPRKRQQSPTSTTAAAAAAAPTSELPHVKAERAFQDFVSAKFRETETNSNPMTVQLLIDTVVGVVKATQLAASTLISWYEFETENNKGSIVNLPNIIRAYLSPHAKLLPQAVALDTIVDYIIEFCFLSRSFHGMFKTKTNSDAFNAAVKSYLENHVRLAAAAAAAVAAAPRKSPVAQKRSKSPPSSYSKKRKKRRHSADNLRFDFGLDPRFDLLAEHPLNKLHKLDFEEEIHYLTVGCHLEVYGEGVYNVEVTQIGACVLDGHRKRKRRFFAPVFCGDFTASLLAKLGFNVRGGRRDFGIKDVTFDLMDKRDLECVTLKDALGDFVDFLKRELDRSDKTGVILAFAYRETLTYLMRALKAADRGYEREIADLVKGVAFLENPIRSRYMNKSEGELRLSLKNACLLTFSREDLEDEVDLRELENAQGKATALIKILDELTKEERDEPQLEAAKKVGYFRYEKSVFGAFSNYISIISELKSLRRSVKKAVGGKRLLLSGVFETFPNSYAQTRFASLIEKDRVVSAVFIECLAAAGLDLQRLKRLRFASKGYRQLFDSIKEETFSRLKERSHGGVVDQFEMCIDAAIDWLNTHSDKDKLEPEKAKKAPKAHHYSHETVVVGGGQAALCDINLPPEPPLPSVPHYQPPTPVPVPRPIPPPGIRPTPGVIRPPGYPQHLPLPPGGFSVPPPGFQAFPPRPPPPRPPSHGFQPVPPPQMRPNQPRPNFLVPPPPPPPPPPSQPSVPSLLTLDCPPPPTESISPEPFVEEPQQQPPAKSAKVEKKPNPPSNLPAWVISEKRSQAFNEDNCDEEEEPFEEGEVAEEEDYDEDVNKTPPVYIPGEEQRYMDLDEDLPDAEAMEEKEEELCELKLSDDDGDDVEDVNHEKEAEKYQDKEEEEGEKAGEIGDLLKLLGQNKVKITDKDVIDDRGGDKVEQFEDDNDDCFDDPEPIELEENDDDNLQDGKSDANSIRKSKPRREEEEEDANPNGDFMPRRKQVDFFGRKNSFQEQGVPEEQENGKRRRRNETPVANPFEEQRNDDDKPQKNPFEEEKPKEEAAAAPVEDDDHRDADNNHEAGFDEETKEEEKSEENSPIIPERSIKKKREPEANDDFRPRQAEAELTPDDLGLGRTRRKFDRSELRSLKDFLEDFPCESKGMIRLCDRMKKNDPKWRQTDSKIIIIDLLKLLKRSREGLTVDDLADRVDNATNVQRIKHRLSFDVFGRDQGRKSYRDFGIYHPLLDFLIDCFSSNRAGEKEGNSEMNPREEEDKRVEISQWQWFMHCIEVVRSLYAKKIKCMDKWKPLHEHLFFYHPIRRAVKETSDLVDVLNALVLHMANSRIPMATIERSIKEQRLADGKALKLVKEHFQLEKASSKLLRSHSVALSEGLTDYLRKKIFSLQIPNPIIELECAESDAVPDNLNDLRVYFFHCMCEQLWQMVQKGRFGYEASFNKVDREKVTELANKWILALLRWKIDLSFTNYFLAGTLVEHLTRQFQPDNEQVPKSVIIALTHDWMQIKFQKLPSKLLCTSKIRKSLENYLSSLSDLVPKDDLDPVEEYADESDVANAVLVDDLEMAEGESWKYANLLVCGLPKMTMHVKIYKVTPELERLGLTLETMDDKMTPDKMIKVKLSRETSDEMTVVPSKYVLAKVQTFDCRTEMNKEAYSMAVLSRYCKHFGLDGISVYGGIINLDNGFDMTLDPTCNTDFAVRNSNSVYSLGSVVKFLISLKENRSYQEYLNCCVENDEEFLRLGDSVRIREFLLRGKKKPRREQMAAPKEPKRKPVNAMEDKLKHRNLLDAVQRRAFEGLFKRDITKAKSALETTLRLIYACDGLSLEELKKLFISSGKGRSFLENAYLNKFRKVYAEEDQELLGEDLNVLYDRKCLGVINGNSKARHFVPLLALFGDRFSKFVPKFEKRSIIKPFPPLNKVLDDMANKKADAKTRLEMHVCVVDRAMAFICVDDASNAIIKAGSRMLRESELDLCRREKLSKAVVWSVLENLNDFLDVEFRVKTELDLSALFDGSRVEFSRPLETLRYRLETLEEGEVSPALILCENLYDPTSPFESKFDSVRKIFSFIISELLRPNRLKKKQEYQMKVMLANKLRRPLPQRQFEENSASKRAKCFE